MLPSGVACAEGFGFGRHLRLLKSAEYAAVFSERRTLRGDVFVIHYRPNGLPFPRLGLVIAKKQARTAVMRNAIKRQAREQFRLRCSLLPAVDLVLRLTRVPPADKALWREEIGALFDRVARLLAGEGLS